MVVTVLVVVVTAALSAGAAHAEGPSAELSVSVAVVRVCTVATPALVVVGDELARDGAAARVGDDVSLLCSEGGEAAVHVGSPSLEDALQALLERDRARAVAAARRAGPS